MYEKRKEIRTYAYSWSHLCRHASKYHGVLRCSNCAYKWVFDRAPLEGLLQRSWSYFGGATICSASKNSSGSSVFLEKRLLLQIVWLSYIGGARVEG